MHDRYILTLALVLPSISGFAQCTFTPTISPANPILCPDATDTLTTQVYGAYQWYKDGSAIPGATAQTLVVEQATDAGSTFSVSATLDGCTEMSAPVLVDGWVFLLPYVIHGGDAPINQGPELQFCEGDTLTLTLSPGYTENIVWTNNGNPIPGATAPVLTVTTDGNYSVTAAPGECPNSIMGIGVEVAVNFTPNIQPDIVDLGDGQICVYPTGNSTQWYFEGAPIGTTDCITPSSTGAYTAFVDYGLPCQSMSDPWFPTGITERSLDRPSLGSNPVRGTLVIMWHQGIARGGEWMLLDLLGRPVRTGTVPYTANSTVDVGNLMNGSYVLVSANSSWLPVRFLVHH